ncbi:MAG: aminopeptidase P family protein [Hyphomicrobiales bacterium]|nr:aminopeptidase P family protein [Hyphomicrobiales bacterium]MCP5371038.1 aminopeptidase P family protein [Hyphomicrobiales bacterium]
MRQTHINFKFHAQGGKRESPCRHRPGYRYSGEPPGQARETGRGETVTDRTAAAPDPAPAAIGDDDGALTGLLRQAGSPLDAVALRDLVRGVLAAPEPFDGTAWMTLVAEHPDPALRARLAALLADARAAATDGLDRVGTDPARLAALRAELAKRGLDGLLVPRGDEHLGEYVARRAERLAWLTGFTGSAGLAIVVADGAAIFVDGRYTLQAEAEVDGDLFARRHLTEDPPTDWLAAHAGTGGRIGYDPWLHTPAAVARFRRACAKAGAELVPCDGNPIDAVWPDQPPPPLSPVVVHDLAHAGESSADKRRAIGEKLAADGLDAVVLAAPDSLAWLANLRGADVPFTPLPLGFAVLRANATLDLFLDPRKVPPATRAALGNGISVSPPDAFGPALDALGTAGHSVAADPDATPAWIFDRLRAAGARVREQGDPCQGPKARKNDTELAGMRAAHGRDGRALTRFLAWLAREAPGGGVTETAAADRLEALRRENDLFRGLSFPTISGSGGNGAIVHYRVTPRTDRALQPGELFLVDSGAQYLDGTTDVTRTVAVGTPSDEMRHRFTLVLKGHIALATAAFPQGTWGGQLDALARQHLWRAGLDFDHGTGHGVGSYLSVHEGPQRISKLPNKVALEPGMVISNEPGYYKTGAYGIRIENLVTVVPLPAPEGAERPLLGFETLTLAPIDRQLVEPGLLDDGERAWLNAYHARVRDALLPGLDVSDGDWLRAVTEPV